MGPATPSGHPHVAGRPGLRRAGRVSGGRSGRWRHPAGRSCRHSFRRGARQPLREFRPEERVPGSDLRRRAGAARRFRDSGLPGAIFQRPVGQRLAADWPRPTMSRWTDRQHPPERRRTANPMTDTPSRADLGSVHRLPGHFLWFPEHEAALPAGKRLRAGPVHRGRDVEVNHGKGLMTMPRRMDASLADAVRQIRMRDLADC